MLHLEFTETLTITIILKPECKSPLQYYNLVLNEHMQYNFIYKTFCLLFESKCINISISFKGPNRKSSLPEQRKKRLSTRPPGRRLSPHTLSAEPVQANRRPPPLPPGAMPVMEKPPSLKVPPLPAMPHPRPSSAYQQIQDAIKPTVTKSVSVGDIPRIALAEGNGRVVLSCFVNVTYNINTYE